MYDQLWIPRAFFYHFAKLIGAVPNFIFRGLLGSKSSEAKAAYPGPVLEGEPTVQLNADFMNKIVGDDETWDWDVNFYGCRYENLNANNDECANGKVTTGVREWLKAEDDDTSPAPDVYHDYAKDCLGSVIGAGPEYSVTPYATDDSSDSLMVGLKVGSWQRNDWRCNTRSSDPNFQRVALYVGMDYNSLSAYAWNGSRGAEADKIGQELFTDNSGGGSVPPGDGPSGSCTGSDCPPAPSGTIAEVALAEAALWSNGTLHAGPGPSGCGRYGAGDSNCVDWCAYFVSWVLTQAGESRGTNSGAEQWAGMVTRVSSPTPGDLAFWDFNGNGSVDHVNIVVTSDGQTVGGNEGCSVGTGANTNVVCGPRKLTGDFLYYGRLN